MLSLELKNMIFKDNFQDCTFVNTVCCFNRNPYLGEKGQDDAGQSSAPRVFQFLRTPGSLLLVATSMIDERYNGNFWFAISLIAGAVSLPFPIPFSFSLPLPLSLPLPFPISTFTLPFSSVARLSRFPSVSRISEGRLPARISRLSRFSWFSDILRRLSTRIFTIVYRGWRSCLVWTGL